MRAATAETARVGDLVEAVESDVALAISVLRFANRSGIAAGGVGGIPEAIDVLKPSGVLAIAGTAPSLRLLRVQRRLGAEARALPRPRPRHPAAPPTRSAARSAGSNATSSPSPRCCTTSAASSSPACTRATRSTSTPSPAPPSSACARNASSSASTTPWSAASSPGAGTCRSGSPSRSSATTPRTPKAWRRWSPPPTWSPTTPRARRSRRSACAPAAERCGLGPDGLRDLLYELPYPRQDVPRVSEPCPLSARELDVLRHLSEGMVYKQIAGEMQLSVSTIRTHLHNVYGKIGAVDRAQAVLTARDRGWI